MTFKDYQIFTATTAIYPKEQAEEYLMYGLTSEVGELAGKLKKEIRDNNYRDANAISAELGDILWYVSELCTTFGLDMEKVGIMNVGKLASRKQRGKIGGSGDVR